MEKISFSNVNLRQVAPSVIKMSETNVNYVITDPNAKFNFLNFLFLKLVF